MIFKKFRAFFSSTVYVQLRENRIKIVNIKTQSVYDQLPYIAIDATNPKQRVIRAIGIDAYNLRLDKSLDVSNPFSHPRLLVADFIKAEKVLMQGMREVQSSKYLVPRPVAIIHPMDKLEGGVTDVECKMYRELAIGAGAREVHIHVGDVLDANSFDMNQILSPEQVE
jgi:rod shape-determining protein MreB